LGLVGVGTHGGDSAGVGIAYRKYLGACTLQQPLESIPQDQIRVLQLTVGTVSFLCITIYGWVDRHDLTHGAVHDIVCWAKTMHPPWVIGGDFNTLPGPSLRA
jgi:hypothetical protein